MSDQSSAAAAASDPVAGVNVRKEVLDALSLLDFAVANGVKTSDGGKVSEGIVATIKNTAAKLGLMGDAASGTLTAAEWATFEMAYYDLATALHPVTAETLRNTRFVPYNQRTWGEHIGGYSPALSFTRLLWLVTMVCAVYVIWASWYLGVKSEQGDTGSYLTLRVLIEVLTPWMYGALGACIFLLRSAHVFIYQRCFDIRRKPEYTNRILLGAASGGAIMLFVSQVTDDKGDIINLSSAALGFLAGYNTDFLFNTVERVMAALLPKVGIDSVKKEHGGAKPADINDLADRMERATGADKEFYRAMLAKLTGARTPPQT